MKKREGLSITFLIFLPLIVLLISLNIGKYPVNIFDLLNILKAKIFHSELTVDALTLNVFLNVRLPRILSAVFVGAALSLSGSVYQLIFANPLASPYTLGVTNAAAFGASLFIVMGASVIFVQAGAIFFGIMTIFSILYISKIRDFGIQTLLLTGLLVGTLFSSLTAFLKFVADPFEKLPQIIFWIMGSLTHADYKKLLIILPLYLVSIFFIYKYRWRINILSLGDERAKNVGVNASFDRFIILILTGSLTSLAVSISGVIGGVGLIIPNLCRMIVGDDFRKLFFASISMGVSFLLFVDILARSIAPGEIPIGILTGIISVFVFFYLMIRKGEF